MGGSVFSEHAQTVRVDREEHDAIAGDVAEALAPLGIHARPLPSLRSKTSFGDVDMICARSQTHGGLPEEGEEMVRALALRHALSAKAKAGELIIWSDAQLAEAKTKILRAAFDKQSLANVLIVDGAEVNANFALAARNLPNVDVLPVQGANVYDIMRRHKLVLTRNAVEALEARFK